jgi:phenylalanyl-tRNA synthetase beta chain
MGAHELDALEVPADAARRRAVQLANPLSDEQPLMRTTLLPGLFGAVARNTSRGHSDFALFEIAAVSVLREGQSAPGSTPAPTLGVSARPTDEQLAQLEALLPEQPRLLSLAIVGNQNLAGWWGSGTSATWADAIDAALGVASDLGVTLEVRSAAVAPWHPGRCAALFADDALIGYAGEISPKVLERLGLPQRLVVAELNLDALIELANVIPAAPRIWTFPVAKEDIALVVAKDVSASAVLAEVREACGELLESIRLFDVYEGAQVPEGFKSLAFALRFRAQDRTLSADEVATARQAGIQAANAKFGAKLR